MYTLKKHKQKLKKRGLGPFVVSQFSSSGAVRLETLDGAEMPNFINESRLKKYELPLTTEMLEQLHNSKTYKEGQARLKAKAQKEAKERRDKIKARRAKILTLQTDVPEVREEEPILPFRILLNFTDKISQSALIDSGADCNVMPYGTWELLGCPKLIPTTVSFISFADSKTLSEGKLSITVQIGSKVLLSIFLLPHKISLTLIYCLVDSGLLVTICS